MKFLKKNMKVIVAFVLGSILTGGIVFASGEYLASQVDYKNNKTVENALDDLYGKIPSGEEVITANGNYDISDKASVQVNVTTVAGTKTLLWTNPNPDNNFEPTTVTLNSELSNFTHFIIQYKKNKTSTEILEDLYKVEPLRTQTSINRYGFVTNTGSTNILRVMYSDSATMFISRAVYQAVSGDDNSYLIPLNIYGINISY